MSAPRKPIAPMDPMRIAWAIAIAHGVNDTYASFLHPLLPRIMDRLGLSVALAATLAMVLSLAASLAQPVLGWWADHVDRRAFVVAGPLLSGVFLSAIGVAPGFVGLVVLLALGGLGSAAFHPPAAAIAGRVTEGKGSGLRVSLFSFGGAVGAALGPLIAVAWVARFGLERLWFAAIPAVLFSLWLWRALPPGRPDRDPARPPPRPTTLLRGLWGPLGLIFLISTFGAFAMRVYTVFQPIVVARAGGSEALGAALLSVYLGAQALGTFFGGWATDRFDRSRVLATLTALAVPLHLGTLWMSPDHPVTFISAGLAGFVNMALLPPLLVIAQEVAPEGASAVSGIAMGLAWAAGSVLVLGTGFLGDLWDPRTAALVSYPILWVGTLCALHPGLRRHARAR